MNVQRSISNNSIVIAISIIAVFSFGCSTNSMQYGYESWVESEENGLRKIKPIGAYQYSIQYEPWGYKAKRELRKLTYTSTDLKKQIEGMSDLQYFVLRIGLRKEEGDVLESGITSDLQYQERIAYLNGQVNNDIFLLVGDDTLNCVLHHFERSYGITPYINLSLGFEIDEEEKNAILSEASYDYKDKTLVFNDQIFGTGMVRLAVLAEDLRNIPFIVSDIID